MGVLIKGLTRPAHCGVCIFNIDWYCIINRELEPDGELTHSCPLIEVPKHMYNYQTFLAWLQTNTKTAEEDE